MALLSKDEYLKASNRLAAGFGPTTDYTDPNVGRTAQSGEMGSPFDETPGQVFSVDQLPDPAVAIAYGLPAVPVPAHLILESPEDAVHHIQGKTVEDIRNAELRRELGDPVLGPDNKVTSAEDSLKSLDEREGIFGRAAAKAEDEDEEQGKKGDTKDVQRAEQQPGEDGDGEKSSSRRRGSGS